MFDNYQFLTLIGILAGGFAWTLTWLRSIDQRVNEIDKRLYGIETVLHMKDCCMLKQDQNLKKVE